MNSSSRRQIIFVAFIAFIFFSPIALFTCDYESKTTLPGRSSFMEGSTGQIMKAGVSSIFPQSDQLTKAGITVTKFSSINLALYSNITMNIAYNKLTDGKQVAFAMNIRYDIYGLGSSSIKKSFANELALTLLSAQALRIKDKKN